MTNDNEPTLSHDEFMLFINKQQHDERELFDSNVKSEKDYYNTLNARVRSKDLSDAELAKCRILCLDIIGIWQDYLSRRTGMFTYEVHLNQKAVEMYQKSLIDFERLLVIIEEKINYRKEKHILIEAEKHKGTPEELKAKYLREKLSEKGFFELKKVIRLTNEYQAKLIDNIANRPTNSVRDRLGYQIAMLDSLDFMEKFYNEKGATRYKYFADALNSNVSEIKNQINSLNPQFTGDKHRYKAIEFKQEVKEYYEMLK